MNDKLLSVEEFIERYVNPSAARLAQKMERGEPLDEIEYEIARQAVFGAWG